MRCVFDLPFFDRFVCVCFVCCFLVLLLLFVCVFFLFSSIVFVCCCYIGLHTLVVFFIISHLILFSPLLLDSFNKIPYNVIFMFGRFFFFSFFAVTASAFWHSFGRECRKSIAIRKPREQVAFQVMRLHCDFFLLCSGFFHHRFIDLVVDGIYSLIAVRYKRGEAKLMDLLITGGLFCLKNIVCNVQHVFELIDEIRLFKEDLL